jgi:phosphosulfolactate synthase
MNFHLSQIPERTVNPRKYGLTMVMDKGLSLQETKNFISVGKEYVDVVKLGFGTSVVTPCLREKIEAYKSAGMQVYFGGTLFEAFLVRNQLDDYVAIHEDYGLEYMEISDGSIVIPHAEKCKYIEQMAKHFTIFSEVGSKEAEKVIAPPEWIRQMHDELAAGASYVIAEARESGNVGVYRPSGKPRQGLVSRILAHIPGEKILWEAPQKNQQLYFLKLCGCNVNLGNIAPTEIISLETMRIGLRGDTFGLYLSGESKKFL